MFIKNKVFSGLIQITIIKMKNYRFNGNINKKKVI